MVKNIKNLLISMGNETGNKFSISKMDKLILHQILKMIYQMDIKYFIIEMEIKENKHYMIKELNKRI